MEAEGQLPHLHRTTNFQSRHAPPIRCLHLAPKAEEARLQCRRKPMTSLDPVHCRRLAPMEAVELLPIPLPTRSPRGWLRHLLLRLRLADPAVEARFWMGCLRTTNSTLRSTRRRRLARTVEEVPPRLPPHSPKFLCHYLRQFPLPAGKEAAAPRRLQDQTARPLSQNVPLMAAEAQLRRPMPARAARPTPLAALVPATLAEAQSRSARPARAACGRCQFLAHPPEEQPHLPEAIPPILFFVHSPRAVEELLPNSALPTANSCVLLQKAERMASQDQPPDWVSEDLPPISNPEARPASEFHDFPQPRASPWHEALPMRPAPSRDSLVAECCGARSDKPSTASSKPPRMPDTTIGSHAAAVARPSPA